MIGNNENVIMSHEICLAFNASLVFTNVEHEIYPKIGEHEFYPAHKY